MFTELVLKTVLWAAVLVNDSMCVCRLVIAVWGGSGTKRVWWELQGSC